MARVKKLEMKRVVHDGVIWTYVRDPAKKVDRELDSTFRVFIGFANLPADDEQGMRTKWLGDIRPRDKAAADAFNADIREAHELAQRGLREIAQRGRLLATTEKDVNGKLSVVHERRMFSLENGRAAVWTAPEVPTAGAYCAYMLTAIVAAGLKELVVFCALRECEKFRWAPIRRGERPRHCCEKHRVRDAKRKQRGTK